MTLYTSASGRDVNHASSSSLDEFKECRRKFKLDRIDGWKPRARKASLEFGKAIESSLQYYFENGQKPGDTVSEFQRIWLKWAEIPLVCTDQEGSWGDLYNMGKDMTRMFEIMLPTLPIRNPKFQLLFSKPLWPGSELGDLEFQGWIDILSTLEDGSRLIVDVKTAGKTMDLTPQLLSMDPQLRRYAWVSGIRNVGFLQFVKARPSYKHGDTIALLAQTQDWKPGTSLVVFKYEEAKNEDTDEVFKLVTLGTYESVRLMDETLDGYTGKGSGELKKQAVSDALAHGKLCVVPHDAVTKCRLQWVQAEIPKEELAEIGQDIGSEILRIREANKSGTFHRTAGSAGPTNQCLFCRYNPICLKDPVRRDDNLVQITVQPKSGTGSMILEAEEE